MKAVEEGTSYDLIDPRDGKVTGALPAQEVYNDLVMQAWENGDPGIVFLDRMNRDNPTPGIGWAAAERRSPVDRGPADLIVALALIHHLAIGHNVPLRLMAEFFARLGTWLIIEYVPKDDSQVQRLLASREDVFDGYTEVSFREEFARYYEIVRREPLPDSTRSVYLMKRTGTP